MPEATDLVLVTEPEYRKAEEVFRNAWGTLFEPAPAAESELAKQVLERGGARGRCWRDAVRGSAL